MGVRFISLAEGVDSYRNPDSVNSIIVPITNVMNDQYCYQTSKKIRQVFDYKRRNGQYIGSFAPYGYIKDPKDKHQLIVDPDAAEDVYKRQRFLHYGQWIGDKPPSAQQRVRLAIIAALEKKPADFAAFLRLMEESGFAVKRGRGGVVSFLAPGQEKYTRLRASTLGPDVYKRQTPI